MLPFHPLQPRFVTRPHLAPCLPEPVLGLGVMLVPDGQVVGIVVAVVADAGVFGEAGGHVSYLLPVVIYLFLH